jgi:metallo-beta-lactamase class B
VFAQLSGAKTLIGEADAENARCYFTPDILVADGDTLTLGSKTFRFLHTPGHTAGTISVFYKEGDYTLGMFGGAGLNTLVPGAYDFDGARDAYFASLARLRTMHVDVVLGNHTWNNDTFGKWEQLRTGGENPFVDTTLWGRLLSDYKARLESLIATEQ